MVLRLRQTGACIIILAATARGALLPTGPTPDPIAFHHFPNRVYAFVWRNWNLVPPERLAAVIGTDIKNVQTLARELGCEPASGPFHGERIALTVIRRNWHLLDYSQLLALLGWTEKELADCLIEHDFLWIKLGSLKPRCAPLLYGEPTAEEKAQASWFREIVRSEMARVTEREDRFAFLEELKRVREGGPRAPLDAPLSIRFIHSYFAVFGDPLLHPELDPYPEGYLARLASLGVNGVWLHVVLSKLAPGDLFPEEREAAEVRLGNLRALVQRAKRHGIGVYLYLNEPRGQDEAFFQARPHLRGPRERDLSALCTSAPEVKAYLREGSRRIFEAVPDLAGFFTITASENLTHCYSHGGGDACPRCAARGPAEVIAEVNAILASGALEANPQAEAIVWDWGWAEAWVEGVVSRLPKRCRLMSVSEWGVPIERGGIASTVGEYALSVVGPGPRAISHWEVAAKHGLRTAAKVQVNNTWELSPVPFIPVLKNVGEHMEGLRRQGISGLMLSWSLGGYPSPNLRVVERFCQREIPSVEEALSYVARERYGARAAAKICQAWELFSEAFGEYPFHVGVLYNGPQQMGPANLLFPEKTGYRATMTGIPYDDLDGWRAIYPPDVFARQFRSLAERWEAGVAAFASAIPLVAPGQRRDAEGDLRVAQAIGIHFGSVANQIQFVRARDRVLASKGAEEPLRGLRAICEQEIELARRLYCIACADSRIGFEAANQYFYLPQDLLEKIANLRFILDRWRF